MKMDKVLKSIKNEALEKLWRKIPTKPEECKIYMGVQYLEECDPMKLENLPLVSKKAFEAKGFEEAREIFLTLYGSEVKGLKVRQSAPVGFGKKAI